nr:uncharacterized protein LOC123494081 [Aegilops tauschii subsp. strangulata]
MVQNKRNNTKQTKVLAETSTPGGAKHYVTYMSCLPLEDEEKLSILCFRVLILLKPFSVIVIKKKKINRALISHISKSEYTDLLFVLMVGMLLVSGPFMYYQKRQASPMQGVSRIPTNPPRF